jgi:hypothetical protein
VVVPFLVSRLLMVLVLAATPLLANVPIDQWSRAGDTSIKLNAGRFMAGETDTAQSTTG